MIAAKTTVDDADSASAADGASPDSPRGDTPAVVSFVVSHEALFVATPATCCDACGDSLAVDDDDDDYRIPGHGAYVWARGDETHLESVPLCAACASAIGMTALARWEIEEEEG